MNLHISPNDKWILGTLDVERGFSVGYLYKRSSPVSFKPATKLPFDIAAWLYFGHTQGAKPNTIASDGPVRAFEFKSWSKDSRYLYFRLIAVKRRKAGPV